MRAKEFLSEKHQGKLSPRQQKPTRGLHIFSDGEGWNGDYTQFRLGMALACANGKDPIDMDWKSWIGKAKSAHPYTEEEVEMLKQAYKAVGANYTDLNNGDLESEEINSVNTVSPVSNWNKRS